MERTSVSLDCAARDLTRSGKEETLVLRWYVDDIIICAADDEEVSVVKQVSVVSSSEFVFALREPVKR